MQTGSDTVIDLARITAIADLMTGILDSPDNPARKVWPPALLSKVEVDTDRICIIGNDVLDVAIAASAKQGENVQNCVPKGLELSQLMDIAAALERKP